MIELGNLAPLRALEESFAELEAKIRARPLPDTDPVVQTLAGVRQQLRSALEDAANVELELSASQYASLTGMKVDTLYKRWQRGQLPEARMNGGKLVVPVSALAGNVAA